MVVSGVEPVVLEPVVPLGLVPVAELSVEPDEGLRGSIPSVPGAAALEPEAPVSPGSVVPVPVLPVVPPVVPELDPLVPLDPEPELPPYCANALPVESIASATPTMIRFIPLSSFKNCKGGEAPPP